jgi:hypothetical protein
VTDVFLSYSSKDRGGKSDPGEGGEDATPGIDRITPIVTLLEAQGFEVFWDQKVPPGVNWNKWIKDKLSVAKGALVLWSGNSVESDLVAHEATIAHKQGKLISVLIDDLDAEQVPMGLYTSQAVKLLGWTGRRPWRLPVWAPADGPALHLRYRTNGRRDRHADRLRARSGHAHLEAAPARRVRTRPLLARPRLASNSRGKFAVRRLPRRDSVLGDDPRPTSPPCCSAGCCSSSRPGSLPVAARSSLLPR